MIHSIQISYVRENIAHVLTVPTDDENLPYNLAEAFIEVIDKTDANERTVVKELADYFCMDCMEFKDDDREDKKNEE